MSGATNDAANVPAARLLVPIFVEALCVGEVSSNTSWAKMAPRYQELGRLLSRGKHDSLGTAVVPVPFTEDPAPAPGVHLHWALPKAFTHGSPARARATAVVDGGAVVRVDVTDRGVGYGEAPEVLLVGDGRGATARAVVEKGRVARIEVTDGGSGHRAAPEVTIAPSPQIRYPAAPNRWLILRVFFDGETSLQLAAWVVESDAVTEQEQREPSGVVTRFPVFTLGEEPPLVPYVTVGRQLPLDSWLHGAGGKYLEDPITALGPGDPTFAAFYPTGGGAFGFYDATPPTPPDARAHSALSYLVSGWFADAEQDPLHGLEDRSTWSAAMDRLGWAWTDDPSDPKPPPEILPTGVLCQGQVQDVGWRGSKQDYPSGAPKRPTEIAVGNSATEALAAYLAASIADGDERAERLFEAFQYQLLDTFNEPDGEAQVAAQAEDRGFAKLDGGSSWLIQRIPEGQPGFVPPTGLNTYEPFPEDISARLVALQAAQSARDACARRLADLQARLYANWYVWTYKFQLDQLDETELKDFVATFLDEVEKEAGELRRLDDELHEQAAELERMLRGSKSLTGYALEATPRQRFRQAKDFAVLLPGVGRSAKYAGDAHYLSNGELFCRVSLADAAGTLTALGLHQAGKIDRTDLAKHFQWPSFEGFPEADRDIPELLEQLLVELLLLDVGVAPLLAQIAFGDPREADKVVNAQEAPWDEEGFTQKEAQERARKAGFVGTLPSVMAVNPWQQPWSPILLQWKAAWYPSYAPDAPPEKVLDGWKFALPDTDRPSIPRWCRANGTADPSPAATLAGRAILVSASTSNLAARIDDFVDHAQPGELTDDEKHLLREIACTLRTADLLDQSMDGLGDQLVMRQPELMIPPCTAEGVIHRDVEQGVAERNQSVPLCNNARRTLPEIDRLFSLRAGELEIQELWVVDSFGQALELQVSDLERVIRPPSLRPRDPDSRRLLAVPRLAQALRLDASWVSATDDDVPTNSNPGTTPVCGWLVPNHLDKTLLVLDADGDAVGTLKTNADGKGFSLQPVPGQAFVRPAKNRHLRMLLDSLLVAADGPDLRDLLELIANRGTVIRPSASWGSQGLSVLVGHPLALVRASLRLELPGDPAYDVTLAKVGGEGADDPGVFPRVEFPVYLGNATLAEDGLVGSFGPRNGEATDYRKIRAPFGFDQPRGYVAEQPTAALSYGVSRAAPTLVTLLMDPRCSVRATTGLLPPAELVLPPEAVEALSSRLDLSFFAGPIITHPAAVELPIPGGIEGTWTFLQVDSGSRWPTDLRWRATLDPSAKNAGAGLPADPFQVVDGYLDLKLGKKPRKAKSERGEDS